MSIKAVFLDFYGTLVHEADEVLPQICMEVKRHAAKTCTASEIGAYWWASYSAKFENSCGSAFQSQRELSLASLRETIEFYQSSCIAEEIIQPQFDYWVQPKLYQDTMPFLMSLSGIPAYIISNIDKRDITAVQEKYRLPVTGIVTSEEVAAYKPRPELFLEGLRRSGFRAEQVLHVGDSLSSDIAGARQAGLRTMWLNRGNKPLPGGGAVPDYTARDLQEAVQIILREAAHADAQGPEAPASRR